ncbi:RNA-binding ATPase activator esf2 [Maublancomyces gigas]|uniref:18S rRNA factor 2 n=1 Tax=Discina gigas TaxID=1032678 RepID=A0ABR3GL89_9PEZI
MSAAITDDGDGGKKRDWLGVEDSEGEEDAVSDEEEESRVKGISRATKRRKVDHASDDEDDSGGDEEEEAVGEIDEAPKAKKGKGNGRSKSKDSAENDDELLFTNPNKLKPLTQDELAASKLATSKTGVIYLSRIPPFMKPMKVKQLLSRFGEIGRIFLSPEDPKAYARRIRFGGNKKRNFDEGWVEFRSKKDAKLVAETLNTTTIGGKKGSYYYDDVWNIKYLPKFKWHHLQSQIAYENASRQAKMRTEMAQATRENKTYIRNVERAKMVKNMEIKKRKLNEDAGNGGREEKVEVRRQFRQNKTKGVAQEGVRAESSEKVKRLLSNIF